MTTYAIDLDKPFTGTAIAVLKNNQCVHSGKSLNELNTKYGGNIVAMNEELFMNKCSDYFDEMCQKPWKEITEAQWWESYECLPPMNWTQQNGVTYFINPEADTAHVHSAYLCVHNEGKARYFASQKSRFDNASKLIKDFLENDLPRLS